MNGAQMLCKGCADKAPIRLKSLMGAKKAKFISVAIVSQVPPQESTPAWPMQFLR